MPTVTIEGVGKFNADANNHLRTGGEASVHIYNNLAVKLLTDSVKARANGLEEKVELLSQIISPRIATPKHKVFSNSGDLLGYAMPLIKGEPVFRAISGDWRKKSGFNDGDALKAVEQMRLGNQEAHKFGAVIGDGNEMNYILTNTHGIYLIDTDSWKIGKFPVTAVMDSIRDPMTSDFTEETDWFSFAVVSFQLITGIHPYKGVLQGYSPKDFQKRMKDGASVFHPNIKMNPNTRSFDLIPSGLRAWYEDVFSHKTRKEAPSVSATAPVQVKAPKPVQQVVASGKLQHILLGTFPEDILEVLSIGVILTKNEAFDLKKSHFPSLGKRATGYVRSGPEIFTKDIPLECLGGLSLEDAGNMYFEQIKYESAKEPCRGQSWNIFPTASKVFRNVIYTDNFGVPMFYQYKDKGLVQGPCQALAKKSILDAFSPGGDTIYVLYSDKKGTKYKSWLKMEFGKWTEVSCEETDEYSLNITFFGPVWVEIPEDGVLKYGRVDQYGAGVKIQAAVSMDMTLFSGPNGIYYFKDKSIYQLKLGS